MKLIWHKLICHFPLWLFSNWISLDLAWHFLKIVLWHYLEKLLTLAPTQLGSFLVSKEYRSIKWGLSNTEFTWEKGISIQDQNRGRLSMMHFKLINYCYIYLLLLWQLCRSIRNGIWWCIPTVLTTVRFPYMFLLS